MQNMKAPFYCPECERQAVHPSVLGFVDDAGRFGELDGFACWQCYFIWAAPEANPRISGMIDLGGQPALERFIERLARAGCEPRPRRAP